MRFCLSRVQRGLDVAENTGDRCGRSFQRCHRGDGEQAGHQRILNQVLAFFANRQYLEPYKQFEKCVIHVVAFPCKASLIGTFLTFLQMRRCDAMSFVQDTRQSEHSLQTGLPTLLIHPRLTALAVSSVAPSFPFAPTLARHPESASPPRWCPAPTGRRPA